MQTKVIEVTQSLDGPGNWGKVMLARMDREWDVPSVIDNRWPLLRRCGWGGDEFWAMDLQTGEGALFRIPGDARADLEKRNIWVCPMFVAWLELVYRMGLDYMFALDPAVCLVPDAEFRMQGYRHGRREEAVRLVRTMASLTLNGEAAGIEMDGDDALSALTSLVMNARELLEP